MNINLKTIFAGTVLLLSAESFANTQQLSCEINEMVNPPLKSRSVQYDLNVPLKVPRLSARVDLLAESLSLKFSIITFLSEFTSPGEQVIIVSVTNTANGAHSASNGHGIVESFTNLEKGSLIVRCVVDDN